ncbi:MAG: DUF1194 domain-containing protein [Amaricoccus sp.]
MPHRALPCAALFALLAAPAHAGSLATDVNVATGIDMSESVAIGAIRIELAGLAAALRSPDYVAAIRRGPHGRIGFAVYAWYEKYFPPLIAWRAIGTEAEAAAAAAEIESFDLRVLDFRERGDSFYMSRQTDLSGALDHGRALLDMAPFRSDRGVLNVIGNGTDNVGEDVDAAHARMVGGGFTVNAVVTDSDPALLGYFRNRVTVGRGAFVLAAGPAVDFATVMQRKLAWDIAEGP